MAIIYTQSSAKVGRKSCFLVTSAHYLPSLIMSTDTGASADKIGSTSIICTSLSCFFRWYFSVVSPPFLIVFVEAGASVDGTGDTSAICTSSSNFFQ